MTGPRCNKVKGMCEGGTPENWGGAPSVCGNHPIQWGTQLSGEAFQGEGKKQRKSASTSLRLQTFLWNYCL